MKPSNSASPATPSPADSKPRGSATPGLLSAKIQPRHRQRQALIYIRQSTPQQVLHNTESAERQYALQQRAQSLGWPAQQVRVLDEDQGRSGQSADGRPGFQHLLAEVALDHVGIIFGLEMSRLARSNKDWHHLLELCALFDTLLADQDGVYDPRDHNDRLLLGLKGTMSEAELHLIRSRLYQGLLNKARKGEVYNHPPIGYVKLPTGEFARDPDEQVQGVVRLVFDQFDRQGTVYGLLCFLARQGIRLPVRPLAGPERGQLQWRRPNRVTLQAMLEHPIYAGFYRWGHRAVDPRRKVAGRRNSGRTKQKPGDCLVLLPEHCPAYITAERFWANQERLQANRASRSSPGAPRRGPSLLGGLLVCGRCGYRLLVNYSNSGRGLRYSCCRAAVAYGEPECQSLSGTALDAFVAGQVLAVLQPAAIELHLAAAADVEGQRRQLHEHWRQRLERAEYERDRAARQYQAVEPENRLVARELERRWEEALQQQQRLQAEHEQFQRQQPARLTAAEREQIRELARDLPGLWQAATTTAADRQRVVRLLIERVVVEVQGQTEQVDLTVHWAGESVTRHRLLRGVQRYEQLADYERLTARMAELRRQGRSMAEVAAALNTEGFHPPRRVQRFTGGMVAGLLARQGEAGAGRQSQAAAALLRKGEWLLGDLARHLGMPRVTLDRWRRVGWLQARKLPLPGGLWAARATGPERRRLAALRRYQREHPNQPIPPELRTPIKAETRRG
jgi:DNA invertase Pin-like site-specific DNA recombinase